MMLQNREYEELSSPGICCPFLTQPGFMAICLTEAHTLVYNHFILWLPPLAAQFFMGEKLFCKENKATVVQ